MAENTKILSAEDAEKLLRPIDEHIGEIQKKIDALRVDGADKVAELTDELRMAKESKTLTAEQKEKIRKKDEALLSEAKKTEAANKAQVEKLIAEGEAYLKAHYNTEYLDKIKASGAGEREAAAATYSRKVEALKAEHEKSLAALKGKLASASGEEKTTLQKEIKDETYVFKNRMFDAKMVYRKDLQAVKDREHEAFTHEYHLIDLLRKSKFTFAQQRAQSRELSRYTFSWKQFFLRNGLYIVIVAVFIALGFITPAVKHTQLFTATNILNILQQASPRMFLALGVAGLILLTGTDLSIGRMMGMGMVTCTIIMHKGPNTGTVFGKAFDLSGMPLAGRAILALVLTILFCVIFTSIAGFFTARFKMHPFISTMANMLIIFGLVTYATKGVSFGAIENAIPNAVIPKIKGFPTIILWAVAAIVIVWFIWNKTKFGKYLYAVGGNPEAAAVSGISVFAVTLGAFMLAGVLYGFGAWLECNRMIGSGSAAYGQGWDMDAIAACVVGGVSFTGGIGKISGVVVGVLIFTALTYSLTILGIDTNLQFVFEGIIILAVVTLDCLKYVQKK